MQKSLRLTKASYLKVVSGFLFLFFLYSCDDGTSGAITDNPPEEEVLDDIDDGSQTMQSDSAQLQHDIWDGLYDSIPPLSDQEFRATYPAEMTIDRRDYYPLTWDVLSQVTFEERFNKEQQAYFGYPTYSADLLAFHNREVVVTGHLIPFEPETGGYFLSANPNASCFFCGEAGPETVIALTIEDVTDEMVLDAVLTFRGKLLLNRKDIFQMNYRIPNAVLVEK